MNYSLDNLILITVIFIYVFESFYLFIELDYM